MNISHNSRAQNLINPPKIIQRQDFPRTIETHGQFNMSSQFHNGHEVSSYYAPTPMENPFIDTSVD